MGGKPVYIAGGLVIVGGIAYAWSKRAAAVEAGEALDPRAPILDGGVGRNVAPPGPAPEGYLLDVTPSLDVSVRPACVFARSKSSAVVNAATGAVEVSDRTRGFLSEWDAETHWIRVADVTQWGFGRTRHFGGKNLGPEGLGWYRVNGPTLIPTNAKGTNVANRLSRAEQRKWKMEGADDIRDDANRVWPGNDFHFHQVWMNKVFGPERGPSLQIHWVPRQTRDRENIDLARGISDVEFVPGERVGQGSDTTGHIRWVRGFQCGDNVWLRTEDSRNFWPIADWDERVIYLVSRRGRAAFLRTYVGGTNRTQWQYRVLPAGQWNPTFGGRRMKPLVLPRRDYWSHHPDGWLSRSSRIHGFPYAGAMLKRFLELPVVTDFPGLNIGGGVRRPGFNVVTADHDFTLNGQTGQPLYPDRAPRVPSAALR